MESSTLPFVVRFRIRVVVDKETRRKNELFNFLVIFLSPSNVVVIVVVGAAAGGGSAVV